MIDKVPGKMNEIKGYRWIASTMLAVFFSAQILANDDVPVPNSVDSLTLPSWEITTQDGGKISSDSLGNKPYILHFWATWCPYCKKLQPGLEALYQKYQTQGIELIGISYNEDPETYPQTVLEKRGHSFVTGVEGEDVAQLLDVPGTPTTFFVFGDGRVLAKTRISDPNDERLEKAVLMLLEHFKENN